MLESSRSFWDKLALGLNTGWENKIEEGEFLRVSPQPKERLERESPSPTPSFYFLFFMKVP